MKEKDNYFLMTDAWYIPVTSNKLNFEKEIIGDEVIYTFIYGAKENGRLSPYSFLKITTI